MIDIKLFGPAVISYDGSRLVGSALGGSKPRQVFEMLALDLGTPIPKDLLAERLWDGRPPASYIATVESYVCSLRRRLGLGAGRRGPLATTHHGYLLDPEHVRVDVASVRSLLAGDVADVTLALGHDVEAARGRAVPRQLGGRGAGPSTSCWRGPAPGCAGGQRAPRARVGGPAGRRPPGAPTAPSRRCAS